MKQRTGRTGPSELEDKVEKKKPRKSKKRKRGSERMKRG